MSFDLIILIKKFSDLCSKIEHILSSVLWFVNAIKSNLISSLNQQSTHHHHLFHMALQADNLTNKVIYSYRAPHTDETLPTFVLKFISVCYTDKTLSTFVLKFISLSL
jgi:hypothetical protein